MPGPTYKARRPRRRLYHPIKRYGTSGTGVVRKERGERSRIQRNKDFTGQAWARAQKPSRMTAKWKLARRIMKAKKR